MQGVLDHESRGKKSLLQFLDDNKPFSRKTHANQCHDIKRILTYPKHFMNWLFKYICYNPELRIRGYYVHTSVVAARCGCVHYDSHTNYPIISNFTMSLVTKISDIQDDHQRPFWNENIKVAYWSEIAKHVMESDFRHPKWSSATILWKTVDR